MPSLAEKLAAKRKQVVPIKEQEGYEGEATVALFLSLYEGNPRLFYVDYFKNYKLLINWLGLPSTTEVTGKIPRLFMSYELQEIAKLLQVDAYEVYEILMKDQSIRGSKKS